MATREHTIEGSIESKRWVQLAWWLSFGVGLIIIAAALPYYFSRSNDASYHGIYADQYILADTPWHQPLNVLKNLIPLSSVVISLILAWVLFRKKSGDRMVIYLSFFLLMYGIGVVGPLGVLIEEWTEITWIAGSLISAVLFAPPFLALMFLFPDGRFVPPWTRWLLALSIPIILIGYALEIMVALLLNYSPGWIGVTWTTLFAIGASFTQVYRYRRISGPVEKQQTKWVVYGLALMCTLLGSAAVSSAVIFSLPPGSTLPWWVEISEVAYGLSFIALPLSLTIAVLGYRLYDIDLIINRTLVYGVLTACTMGIYVVIVGYLGNLIQTPDRSILAFLTTGIVALLFQPLRERLQGIVNRLMYGERDDPVAILTNLSKRLENTISPEAILPGLVETVASTLKLPYVAIEIYDGEPGEVIAAYGEPQEELERFPLIHQAQTIGELLVASRAPGESFSESESRLLRNIAQQAGAAVHAIHLTRDLQHSRQRLVTAREEERRRLRRDLHDGLGPVLASQGLKIAAATELLNTDPQKARQMLEELNVQNEETVAEIRRLVYALRPSSLDELGLVGAVRDYAVGLNGGYLRSSSTRVNVRAPQNGLPPLPAAVEVAAYRIATEALTNVFRHAQAKHCSVSFLVESSNGTRTLLLEVKDDGCGLPQEREPGMGLTTMRERAEELSGTFLIESTHQLGTRVVARLPLVD